MTGVINNETMGIRDDLERHGVLIGYDSEFTTPDFGCDLDYQEAQVESIRKIGWSVSLYMTKACGLSSGREPCTAASSVNVAASYSGYR